MTKNIYQQESQPICGAGRNATPPILSRSDDLVTEGSNRDCAAFELFDTMFLLLTNCAAAFPQIGEDRWSQEQIKFHSQIDRSIEIRARREGRIGQLENNVIY